MKRIYICGPTIYEDTHIGNFRPLITFDIYIRAWKILKQENVHLTHNITDVDDKIITKAISQKVPEKVITTKYLKKYNKLVKTLNIICINEQPLVTNNITKIVDFIKKLMNLNVAYEVDGNLFFDVSKINFYGQISNQNSNNLISNKYNKLKKNANDFVLWKKTNIGITFDSPWGKGRPGWHTECVALISSTYGGKSLDIHSGGIDLIFPHHENEEAQFRVVYGRSITREWKHIGQINLRNIKMSKSLNNFIDTNTFIKNYGVDTLRMLFLSVNATKPMNITQDFIENVSNNLKKIRDSYLKAKLMNAEIKICKQALKWILNWQFAEFIKIFYDSKKKFIKFCKLSI